MKRLLFAILAISGVALAWAAPPLDRLPELLVPPTEARITSVIVGGSVPSEPPASLTREGYQEYKHDSGETAYAWNVTIPSNTTCIVLTVGGYSVYSGNPLESANLNGTQNFTVDQNADNSGGVSVGVAHLFSPGATGSQTINFTTGSYGYDAYVYVIYYSGTATDGLRDSDGGVTNSLTLTTVSGDAVVSVSVREESTIDFTNATEIDENYLDYGATVGIAETSADGVSETVGTNGAVLASIVLKPAS